MNSRTKLLAEIAIAEQRLNEHRENIYFHKQYFRHFIALHKVILSLLIPLSLIPIVKLIRSVHFYKGISKLLQIGFVVTKFQELFSTLYPYYKKLEKYT